ncbi:MAG: hypothetical protein PXX83_09370 [Candidatus Nitrosotalea sp.]|nr:hypothetical protein [Candidatus Nitrosotalea sp.]
MKIIYLGIILAFLLVAMSEAKPIHAESSGPVQILNVQVQPNIKVNDTFSLNMTILNNSAFPIYLTSGSCTPAFSVVFDAHAKQVYPNITCTTEAILQKVDPQSQVTISNANKPGIIYQAVQPGTATVNITLPYYAKNQTATDYSNIYYNASKSFSFTILNQSETPPQHAYGGGGPVVTITLDPLEQFKSGISAKDVTCKEGLQLVIKAEDGSPACVKYDTAQKLIEREWTTNSQIAYPCPTTDPSKISVDFPVKLPAILPNGYSLQGIEQNGRIQVYAYYANKSLCAPDHNFQFHDIQLLVTIGKQQRPLPNLEYYQLIPQLVGSEWDIPLGPNLISELANEGITVQPLEINGYKGFGWVPWDTPVYTEQLDVIDPNRTASSLFFYNNNDQDVYSLIDFDHQSVVRLSNIARSIPP